MEELPKPRLSAAIFRRGGEKKELFGQTHEEDVSDEFVLAEKIGNLEAVWCAPRIGQDLSAAVWKPRARAAELVVTKKSFSTSMGFHWRGKIYLNIEEAVYLLERGDLLLFIEDQQQEKQLLSIQEAFTLLVSEGCDMDRYITYSTLMRIGYLVRRWPSMWALERDMGPAEMLHQGAWALPSRPSSRPSSSTAGPTAGQASSRPSSSTAGPTAGYASSSQQQQQQQQPNGTAGLSHSTPAATAAPPLSSPAASEAEHARKRQRTEALQQASSGWWPAMHSSSHPWLDAALPADIYQQLAPCVQVAAPSASLLQRFPRMRPLGKLQQHSLEQLPGQQQAGSVHPHFDVYKPNSKFSRKGPDAVAWRLIVADGMIPTLAMQRAADSYCMDGAKLRMAIVQDGDVSFYGIDPASLTQLLS